MIVIKIYLAASIAGYFMIQFRLTVLAIIMSIIISAAYVWYNYNEANYLELAPNYERTVAHYKFDNLVEATYKMEDIFKEKEYISDKEYTLNRRDINSPNGQCLKGSNPGIFTNNESSFNPFVAFVFTTSSPLRLMRCSPFSILLQSVYN